MRREHHRWYSPALGKEMEMLVFGHGGARMLVFPTSKGKFYEWEDRGMFETLRQPLEQGWLQAFCVDSVDEESWYANWKWPGDRAWRHEQYDMYLTREVIPFSQHNPNPFLIVTGASFGAYHAVNFAFKHPHLVGRVLAMNGMYDIRGWMDGHNDDNVYFNNPVDFIANEHDPHRLAAMRRMDIILTTSEDEPKRRDTEDFSRLLWEKSIWHALRIWKGWAHDWPWWKEMVKLYLSGPS
ncbi:MAG: esterase [Caldilineales bacterium]|nr:esterase [Caldilineales bacterium]MCW5857731.1 esterase family protein [Caldilineales bacterium]